MTRLPHDHAVGRRRKPRCERATSCATPRCPNPPRANRKFCCTCRDRAWRKKHFEHHLWNNLKKSAKRRGHEFTISLTWWICWCEMTGFAEMVGRTKGSVSIDRIESWRGYHEDNIRMLEVGANSAKGRDPPPINSDDGPTEYTTLTERPPF